MRIEIKYKVNEDTEIKFGVNLNVPPKDEGEKGGISELIRLYENLGIFGNIELSEGNLEIKIKRGEKGER